MDLLSPLKKDEHLKCDWCGEEMEKSYFTKCVDGEKYNFCSKSCKKDFRASHKNRGSTSSCPTCMFRTM